MTKRRRIGCANEEADEEARDRADEIQKLRDTMHRAEEVLHRVTQWPQPHSQDEVAKHSDHWKSRFQALGVAREHALSVYEAEINRITSNETAIVRDAASWKIRFELGARRPAESAQPPAASYFDDWFFATESIEVADELGRGAEPEERLQPGLFERPGCGVLEVDRTQGIDKELDGTAHLWDDKHALH